MKIFPLNATEKVVSPDHGEFTASEDGGFDLPDEFAHFLHSIHVAGQKVWETDGERSLRLLKEEEDRRKDPATLLAAVEALVAQGEKPAPAPKKASPAAKKAAEAQTPAQ